MKRMVYLGGIAFLLGCGTGYPDAKLDSKGKPIKIRDMVNQLGAPSKIEDRPKLCEGCQTYLWGTEVKTFDGITYKYLHVEVNDKGYVFEIDGMTKSGGQTEFDKKFDRIIDDAGRQLEELKAKGDTL